MKLAILLFFSIAINLNCFAQFQKGTILIGGSVSGSYSKQVQNSTTSYAEGFSFMPQAGLFMADNFVAGLGVGYNYMTLRQSASQEKESDSKIALSPFFRYYYRNFFFQGMYQHMWSTDRFTGTQFYPGYSILLDQYSKSQANAFNLGIGYATMINENFAIEPLVGYSNSITKASIGYSQNSSPGFYVQLGFQAYLHRH